MPRLCRAGTGVDGKTDQDTRLLGKAYAFGALSGADRGYRSEIISEPCDQSRATFEYGHMQPRYLSSPLAPVIRAGARWLLLRRLHL